MKLIKILAVLVLMMFVSCGHRTPVFNSTRPFVVSGISVTRNSPAFATYLGQSGTGDGQSSINNRPAIIAPVGMYNIGDTITLILK